VHKSLPPNTAAADNAILFNATRKKHVFTVVWPWIDVDASTSVLTKNTTVIVVVKSQFQSVLTALQTRTLIVKQVDCARLCCALGLILCFLIARRSCCLAWYLTWWLGVCHVRVIGLWTCWWHSAVSTLLSRWYSCCCHAVGDLPWRCQPLDGRKPSQVECREDRLLLWAGSIEVGLYSAEAQLGSSGLSVQFGT